MASNPDLPFEFFVDFFTPTILEHYIKQFQNKYFNEDAIAGKHLIDDCSDTLVSKFLDNDPLTNEMIEYVISFENYIRPIFLKQIKESKRSISAKVLLLNSKELTNNYLTKRRDELQKLVDKNIPTIERFTWLVKPFENLVSLLNEQVESLGFAKESYFKLSFKEIDFDKFKKIESKEPKELIDEIFSFLKGKDDDGNTILSKIIYDYLIKKTNEFIQNTDNLPTINKKLPKLCISNTIIRFSFWVLHMKLHGVKPIKDSYIHFQKLLFADFDNVSFQTLKKSFGDRSRVQRGKFLPEIVKNELSKKK